MVSEGGFAKGWFGIIFKKYISPKILYKILLVEFILQIGFLIKHASAFVFLKYFDLAYFFVGLREALVNPFGNGIHYVGGTGLETKNKNPLGHFMWQLSISIIIFHMSG